MFHTYSHITHINGTIQSNIIHGIWYFVSFMVLIASIKITKQYPQIYAIIILLLIIIIDINLFFLPNKLYMIFTGLSLPAVIIISYYNLYPKLPYHTIIGMVLFTLLSYVFLQSEKYI